MSRPESPPHLAPRPAAPRLAPGLRVVRRVAATHGGSFRLSRSAAGTEAVIDVFAFWGGMEIKVPEDWTVIIRAIPLMGGVDDKTHMVQPPPAVEKRLVISGIVMMGGVVVKN